MQWRGVLKASACVLLAIYLLFLTQRIDLVIVGSFTHDLVGSHGVTRPGGAVSYSAVAARALGVKACVLTVAGPDVGEEFSLFRGHELHVVRGGSTLTFEHTYDWKGDRQLRVVSDPNITLHQDQLPWQCRRARVVLLGPLTPHDVDAASFMKHDSWVDLLLRGPQLVGIIGQGYQRRTDPNGKVLPLQHPSPQLLERHGKRTSLFLSDVETNGFAAEELATVAAQHGRMLITQGSRGAQEWNVSGVFQIDPVKVPQVDSNGAGDTFATAYMIALAQGHPQPGHAAAWTASRAVIAPQSCKPGCAGDALVGHRINGIRSDGGNSITDNSSSSIASNISQLPLDPQPPSPDADTKNCSSPSSSYQCRAWLLAGGAGWFRPWSLPEKLWADLTGLWPHMYAVLYDALAQPARKEDVSQNELGQGAEQQSPGKAVGEASGSCSDTASVEASKGGSRSADQGGGQTCEVSWGNEPPSPPSYLYSAQRWAQHASNRLQGMHHSLCSSSLWTDHSRRGSTNSHGASSHGARHTGTHDARHADEGKEAGPPPLHSLAGLYCGAVSAVRQAGLWVLQLGVSVAARIGLAIDEVARQY